MLSDFGILLELAGFIFLLSTVSKYISFIIELPRIIKLAKKQDRSIDLKYTKNLVRLTGFMFVITGLLLQHSFFNPL